MEAQVFDNLKYKQTITDEIHSRILEKSIATGSYIIGGYDPETSDRDFVLLWNEAFWYDLLPYGFVAGGSIEGDLNYRTIYVKTDNGDIFNMIFIKHQELLDVWIKTQNLLIQLCAIHSDFKELMQDKKFRVGQFEMIRNYLGWTESDQTDEFNDNLCF